jgi:hypothetical protein
MVVAVAGINIFNYNQACQVSGILNSKGDVVLVVPGQPSSFKHSCPPKVLVVKQKLLPSTCTIFFRSIEYSVYHSHSRITINIRDISSLDISRILIVIRDCNKRILKPERLSLTPLPKKETKWAVDFGFIQIDATEQGLEKTKGRQ